MAGQHLYFIQAKATGAVKVGKSDDPQRRLRQLQTGNPNTLRVILFAPDRGCDEQRVHNALRRHKTRHTHGGEWFKEECLGDVPVDIWEFTEPWYRDDPDWWKR